MSLSFLPEMPKIDPEKGPHLMAGAASPLWLMFGGAAMAGATWWWWSARWREAVNVEALMAPALAKTLPTPTPVDLAPEPAIEVTIDPVTEAPVLAPVVLEASEAVTAAATQATEAVAEVVQETLDTAQAVTAETQETLEAVSEPVVEAAAETAKSAADDLSLLVGIGPKLAASLADLGVTRFSEIAAWGPDELADFDARLSLRGRAERDAWVAQARRLANS
jgi:predicted flap endonuclease-1-like 5' DNA nuclease